MLQLHNLSKIYRTDEVETVALNSVNIEIDAGEFVAIMGPSGCGKSTLLNIIGMLDTPTSGSYRFRGEDVSDYSESRLGELRKHNIGFIFQSFNLLNPSNFQAFDAQFGGAQTAQTNPSNVFAQPQTSLLQGRDVIVNPFSQQQNLFGQQQQQQSSAPFTVFRTG